MPYAELHCHSNFSFLDGASHPSDLARLAAELGYEALAITDHDGFYGAPRFRIAAAEVGLPTVYGVEVGLPRAEGTGKPVARRPSPARTRLGGETRQPVGESGVGSPASGDGAKRRGRTHRMHGSKPTALPPTDHLVLLAPDPRGYGAISRLITRAQFRGEKDRPVYDYGDLADASAIGKLITLSGCHQGAVPRAAASGDLAGAMAAASRLREIFPGRLYLEVWDHRMPGDDLRNDVVAEVSARLRIPLVATNNVHYHDRSEANIAEVLAAVGGRRDLDEGYGHWPATDERYLKSPAEMVGRMARYPGAVSHAADLGRALAFDLRLVAPRLPDFPMPGAFRDEMDYLRHLTTEGARKVYPGDGPGNVDPVAMGRLEHELGVIGGLGFPGYFLIVWDIIRFA